MASNLLKFNQAIKIRDLSTAFLLQKTLIQSVQFPKVHHYSFGTQLSFFPYHDHLHKPKNNKISSLSILCSLSSSFNNPPSSREEAILQAKTCLSTTLEKPLNKPKLTGKIKKLKQPRFQVEIPVVDDSPKSLSQLALDVFQGLPIKRKGSRVKILIFWPNPTLKNTAIQVFQSHPSNNVEHVDMSSIIDGDNRILGSAELVVFLAPESSQLEDIKSITECLYPKPVVIFNPKWGFEEESDFGDLSAFVGSFEVIYSFVGLEVRGILSKRKGVVFKCVRDRVVSGERWTILVEEGGEMKVVSKFKTRPSIGEVENVLYNLMAINSPVTKSAKFLKDLVSNVTGKK